ncbi:MAG: ABC-type amino acid transport substrate-binding protein [Motiliproteus sp.]|jgi:ABC-type amino acid transport substrate-binding protein
MWSSVLNSVLNRIPSVGLLRLLIGLLFAGLPVSAQALSYDELLAEGTLRVAIYRNFPPYSYQEEGQAKGVDVDLAQAIASGLGLKLQLHWMTADETLDDDLRNHLWKGHYLARDESGPMLKREVADLMLRVPYDRDFAFKVDSDGRLVNDLVHFFGPYQHESWALVYDTEQLEAIENLAIFQYAQVGVEIDTLPDFYLSSAFRGRLLGNVKHFDSIPLALQAIATGEVAAVMGTQSQLQWGVRQLQQSKQLRPADIPFPNLVRRSWDLGMAVRDDQRELGYAVEDIVGVLVKSGQFERIYRRYNVQYIKPERYRLPEG